MTRHAPLCANAVAETQRSVARTLARFSVSQVMLLSFLLILGSLFLRRLPFTQWVLYLGIVLFVASFAILVFGGGRGSTRAEQNWRGRPVAPRRDVPTLGERLRGWWQDTTRS